MNQTQQQIEKLKSLQESLDWAIDLAENQLPELKSALQEIKDKVSNITIDLSPVAKQGENAEATNTAIYNAVKSLPDLSLLYSARFEQNSDGDNTWTMVMPVVSGVIMNEDDTVTIQM